MFRNSWREWMWRDADPAGGGGGGGKGGDDDPPRKDPPKPADNKPPDPIPYDRFKEVNEKRKEAEAELAKLREAQKKAEEERLTEEKKWQELAEKRQGEIDELHGKLAKAQLRETRLKVAAEYELPSELAERLQGDDEAAMKKDAETLAALVKKRSPGVPPRGSGRPVHSINLDDMTPEEIRKLKPEEQAALLTGG